MYYSIGDATYSYDIYGEGSTIVLLHGFTGSSSTWSTFISELEKDFKLITIDLPGHGKTITKTPRTMESCCRDLMMLFEHLQLTKFHLVGYSMGGRTALSLAMLYPNQILSLTLESTSFGIQSSEERIKRIEKDEKLAQKVETEGILAFVAFWEGVPLFDTQKKLPIKIQQAIQKERLTQSEAGLAESLRYMGTGSQPSWWEQLVDFKQPVLLLAGTLDKKFVKINEQMQKRFRSAVLVQVENAGHAIHIEQPTKFGEIVAEFLLKNT